MADKDIREELRLLFSEKVIDMFPPKIRDKMWSDSAFKNKIGLEADYILSFSNGVSFLRSTLYSAIRKIYGNKDKTIELIDINKESWSLRFEENTEGIILTLYREAKKLVLKKFSILSPILEERIEGLKAKIEGYNLPPDSIEYWTTKLLEKPISDVDMKILENDIEDTSAFSIERILSELQSGTSNISSFAPEMHRYYERLIGRYTEKLSLEEYVRTNLSEHIMNIINWRQKEGFLETLILCSHSSISDQIEQKISILSTDEIIDAYLFMRDYGDRMSQVGAIEIGLSVLNKYPEINPILADIIKQILHDESEDEQSQYKLMSALIILIDSENSHKRTFENFLPFIRRFASISQANLITRHLLKENIDIEHFAKWILSVRARDFYLQNMIDLRLEPRWLPEYISADQIKNECISRISIAANKYNKNIHSEDLCELLFGDEDGNLKSYLQFPSSYFPGPLEGAVSSLDNFPDDLLKTINHQLSTEKVEPKNFYALINFCQVFNLKPEYSKKVANLLKAAKNRIKQVNDSNEIITIINGLAVFAATSKSVELANEIRMLLRRHRREQESGITLDFAVRIGLITAASNHELKDWCEFLGDWITEFAFEELKNDDAVYLHSIILDLCLLVPELWTTLGRAEAALKSIIRY